MRNSRRPTSSNVYCTTFSSISKQTPRKYVIVHKKKASSSHNNKPSTAQSRSRSNAGSNRASWQLTGNQIGKTESAQTDFSHTIQVTALQPTASRGHGDHDATLKQPRYHKPRPATSSGLQSQSTARSMARNKNRRHSHNLVTYDPEHHSKHSSTTPLRWKGKVAHLAITNPTPSANVRTQPQQPPVSLSSTRTNTVSLSYSSIPSSGVHHPHYHQQSSSLSASSSDIKLVIDPKCPSSPIVCRDDSVKSLNRERLNLDNRNLSKCARLRGEENLRLLNYENNQITQIKHLENLRNLIFLDLYNNRISKIENLECIPMLRVLMLGRNQICKIENLHTLRSLDVLDLHSNQICKMENLNHLRELRVLNLAANNITNIENIHNLTNLVELNLRRNVVCNIDSFATHQRLQRVLLSNNNIRNIKTLVAVSEAKRIQQLWVDNNPFYDKFSHHTQHNAGSVYGNALNMKLVSMFPALIQLNNLQITAQIKAQLLLNPVDDNVNNEDKPPSLQPSRGEETADSKVATTESCSLDKQISSTASTQSVATPDAKTLDQVDRNQEEDAKVSQETEVAVEETHDEHASVDHVSLQPKEKRWSEEELIGRIEQHWIDRNEGKEMAEKLLTHSQLEVNEKNERILKLYACGPLDSSVQSTAFSNLQQLHLYYVDFNALTKEFNYLKTLKNICLLRFEHNKIHCLYQIDALSVLSHLKRVGFGLQNKSNPITVTSPALYRSYCIFRLANVVEIDGKAVSKQERETAHQQFGLLRNEWKNSHILVTRGFCAPILNEARNIYATDATQQPLSLYDIFEQFPRFEQRSETDTNRSEKDPQDDGTDGCCEKAREAIQYAVNVHKARQRLSRLWPSILAEYVEEVINDLQT